MDFARPVPRLSLSGSCDPSDSSGRGRRSRQRGHRHRRRHCRSRGRSRVTRSRVGRRRRFSRTIQAIIRRVPLGREAAMRVHPMLPNDRHGVEASTAALGFAPDSARDPVSFLPRIGGCRAARQLRRANERMCADTRMSRSGKSPRRIRPRAAARGEDNSDRRPPRGRWRDGSGVDRTRA